MNAKSAIFILIYLMIGLGVTAGLEARSGKELGYGERWLATIAWPSLVAGRAYYLSGTALDKSTGGK